MSLAVVERYSVLTEAMAARGALESAGIPAIIAEELYAQSDPLMHVALQGFRLCVPASALEDAATLLLAAVEAGRSVPSDIEPPKRGLGWGLAAAAGLVLAGEAAFFIVGIRDRGRRVLPVALLAIPVILIGLAAFLFVLEIFITMLTHPPR